MIQGRANRAEIDVPSIVEIPRVSKNVAVELRFSLHNDGEDVFVAHARNRDDSTFWHVFNQHQEEVQRERGKGKGGVTGVKVRKGVHSYHGATVAPGTGVHRARTLVVHSSKLEPGHTYTVRGEIYGHRAETTFVAVPAAPPRKQKKRAKKKTKPAKKAAGVAKKSPAKGRAKKKAARKAGGKKKKK